MHRLPRHPIAARHIGDRRAVQDLFDRRQPLFHQPQLHQHDPASPADPGVNDAHSKEEGTDQSLETQQLAARGAVARAIAYPVVTALGGLAAVWLGAALAGILRRSQWGGR
jgi:hypothetical protein